MNRIIETAIDENGNSYIFSDKKQEGWSLPGHTITDLFFSNQCPPNMLATHQEITDKNFNLKPGQIRFFRSDIFPTNPVYNDLPIEEKPKDFKKLFYQTSNGTGDLTCKQPPYMKNTSLQMPNSLILQGGTCQFITGHN